MSSSPPPVAKKPRPKPKARLAVPSDDIAASQRAPLPRSPSIPAQAPSSSSALPTSRTPSVNTPITISSSSPEPKPVASSSKIVALVVEPVVRRSSRPTNAFLKKDGSAAANPTWVTAVEPNGQDDEEDIDEIGASSMESLEGADEGKAKKTVLDEEQERRRREKEDEERAIKLRQEADEKRFNEQFKRKPRGWLVRDGISKPKGKGKARSMPQSPGQGTSVQVISDSDEDLTPFDKQRLESDDDSEDGGGGGGSRKRGRPTAATQRKRKLVHDWTVKKTKSSSFGSDSDVMEMGEGTSGNAKKATSRSEKKAVDRQRSMSLTPPPEVDPMLLRRVDSQVRSALAEDQGNPLLEQNRRAPDSDADDDFNFASPPPRAAPQNARAGLSNSGPINIEDSDDEPAPPTVRTRNPKTFDAPVDVQIRVKMVSHLEKGTVSEKAIAHFEKKKTYELGRFDTLGALFGAVARNCQYDVNDLVMTMDSQRIYRSTTVDTLGIYDEATFTGYRKDIYDQSLQRKKLADSARLALLAAEADESSKQRSAANAGHGGSLSAEEDDDGPGSLPIKGNAPASPAHGQPSQAGAAVDGGPKLRLTFRGPHGEAKFACKLTTKISTILKNYGMKRGLEKKVWEGLRIEDPDGETMNSEQVLGDFNVEDDDMLAVS